MRESIVVTRHPALVQYLIELGLVPEGTPIVAHATVDFIMGKDVYGVLPLRLAVHAARVIEVPLDIPAELRGKELSLEQVKKYAGEPQAYTVRRA
ncbi:hypothetical protein J7K50_02245 [bacterium]|nr:hypothetical protein [bacterium]